MKKPKNKKSSSDEKVLDRKMRMESALVQKESSWVLKQFERIEKPNFNY